MNHKAISEMASKKKHFQTFLSHKKKDHAESMIYKNGGYDETWTCDPRIMSAVL